MFYTIYNHDTKHTMGEYATFGGANHVCCELNRDYAQVPEDSDEIVGDVNYSVLYVGTLQEILKLNPNAAIMSYAFTRASAGFWHYYPKTQQVSCDPADIWF